MGLENDSKSKKIRQLDAIDRKILNILCKNSRTKLVKIAKEVNLSIDSVKKRLKKLDDFIIKKYTIQVDDSKLGFNSISHIYIKLKDIQQSRYEEFITTMKKNPRMINLMTVLGDYDIYIVVIAKDHVEMEYIKMKIRHDFSDIIGDWKEVIVANVYKLEEYNF